MNSDSSTDDDITEDENSPGVSVSFLRANRQIGRQYSVTSDAKVNGQIQENNHSRQNDIPVWCKQGKTCMALFEDGTYYRAVINALHVDRDAGSKAEVVFIGYESEGTEVVPIANLKKISQKQKETRQEKQKSGDLVQESAISDCSLFSHLQGNEIDMHMRSKYDEPDGEELDKELLTRLSQEPRDNHRVKNISANENQHVLKTKMKKNKQDKRKTCRLSLNFKEKQCPAPRHAETNDESKDVPTCSNGQSTTAVIPLDEDQLDISWDIDGFDDEDMEKPHFSEPATCPSVPLVLSEPGQIPIVQVPATINCRLRDYQRDGVRFLYQHYKEHTGAILADDMGLGKTVQVIGFLAAVLGKTGTKADVLGKFIGQNSKEKKQSDPISRADGVFLVVCPGCVLYNWKDELDTWGYFKVKLYHSTQKEGVMEQAAKGKLDVVLTTYETMRENLREFSGVKWLAVIMDEVHKLKEPKAKVTKAAKKLDITRRFGLTGTPLQNRLSEFWCVLDWANPGCLGPAKRFDVEYGKPIRKGQRFDANKRELALARTKSQKFQSMLSKWLLRRTKDLISDQLPNKEDKVVFCNLTSFQEDVYVTLLQSPDVQLIKKKDHPCDCGSGGERGKCCYAMSPKGEPLKKLLMRCLQLLLKAANHTGLLMPRIKQTADQRERAKNLCDEVFKRHPQFAESLAESSFQTLSDPTYCGKMKVLDKLVRMFEKEKSKVLLFSQSTQLLNILEEYVIGRGLVYSRLDGSTRPSQRARLVREFNNNPDIFVCLVSTKAGGLGLNFTGANVVIIFDPTWNPANDLQAQDRAYRIGQRRDVQVFRLISSGTIEEMMYLRQIYKQQMANIAIAGTSERRYFTGVEGEKDFKGELFGIENLFAYRAEGANLAQDIIRRTDRVEAGLRVAYYEIVPQKTPEEETKETHQSNENTNLEEDANEDDYDLETVASQFMEEDSNEPSTSQPESLMEPSTSEMWATTNEDELQEDISDDSEDDALVVPFSDHENVEEEESDDSGPSVTKKRKRRTFAGNSRTYDSSCSDVESNGGDRGRAKCTLSSCLKSSEKRVKLKKRVSFGTLFSSSDEGNNKDGTSDNETKEMNTEAERLEKLEDRKTLKNQTTHVGKSDRDNGKNTLAENTDRFRNKRVGGKRKELMNHYGQNASSDNKGKHTEVTKSRRMTRSTEHCHDNNSDMEMSSFENTTKNFTKIRDRSNCKSTNGKLDSQSYGGVIRPSKTTKKLVTLDRKISGRKKGVRSVAGKGDGKGSGGNGGVGGSKSVKGQRGSDSGRSGGSGRSHNTGGSRGEGERSGDGERNNDGDVSDDDFEDDEADQNEDEVESDSEDEGKRSTDGNYMSMSSEHSIDEFETDEDSSAVPTRRSVVTYKTQSRRRTKDASRKTKSSSYTLHSPREKRQKKQRGDESRKNKVEELLDECGVSYTHANRAVVRSTKAESHMSKRAIQDVFELRQFSQQPANCFAVLETSDESDDVAETTTQQSKSKKKQNENRKHHRASTSTQTPQVGRSNQDFTTEVDKTTEIINNMTVFVGSTPRGIRRHHFREMSETLGFDSEVALAESIIELSSNEQSDMLKRYYSVKNPDLESLKCFTDLEEREEKPVTKKLNKKRVRKSGVKMNSIPQSDKQEKSKSQTGNDVKKGSLKLPKTRNGLGGKSSGGMRKTIGSEVICNRRRTGNLVYDVADEYDDDETAGCSNKSDTADESVIYNIDDHPRRTKNPQKINKTSDTHNSNKDQAITESVNTSTSSSGRLVSRSSILDELFTSNVKKQGTVVTHNSSESRTAVKGHRSTDERAELSRNRFLKKSVLDHFI